MRNIIRNAAAVAGAVLLMFSAAFLTAYGDTPTVSYDNGTGNIYGQLAANYVQIKNMSMYNCVIVSGGESYAIEDGYVAKEASAGKRRMLVYKGKLPNGFGTAKRTGTADAKTKLNTFPKFTLKFPNSAVLSDGTVCDVILQCDELKAAIGNSFNSKIKDSTVIRHVVLSSWNKSALELSVACPKLNFDKYNATASDYSSGAPVGQRIKLTMKVVKHTEGISVGAAISSASYPTMLVTFKDLDVRDNLIRTGASYTQKYNGTYSEGVEMVSGWKSPVALAPKSGKDIFNESLVESQSMNGNTRVKGKGSQYERLYKATGDTNDTGTYYSGLVAAVSPQGFTYYWTGSVGGGKTAIGNMGTTISGQPTVAVRAKRSAGGTLSKSYEGSWLSTTYLMNSATQYSYKPNAVYYVKSLKVDGNEQALTDAQRKNGGVYTFTRLNKYPLGSRNYKSGNILMAADSGSYTIEAEFGRNPEYAVKKEAGTDSVRLGSTEKINYKVTVTQDYTDAGTGTFVFEDDLAGDTHYGGSQGTVLSVVPGSVNISVSEGSYKSETTDDGHIKVIFNTPQASGRKQTLIMTYQAEVDWTKYSGGTVKNTVYADDKPEAEADVQVLSDIRITKEVRGNLRDETKKFELTLSLSGLRPRTIYEIVSQGGELSEVITGAVGGTGFSSDERGEAVVTFKMKGGQGVTVRGLPVGCTYRVTEAASDHRASYQLMSDSDSPVLAKVSDRNIVNQTELSTAEETLEKEDGVVTVAFTNTRNSAIRTGLQEHSDWAAALVIAVTVAAIILMTRRRRH